MAQKARMKIFERMKNGTRRHILTIHGVGRTKALAKANVRRNARAALRRNVTDGEMVGGKFHPFRKSPDYDATKLHDAEGKRARAGKGGKSYGKKSRRGRHVS